MMQTRHGARRYGRPPLATGAAAPIPDQRLYRALAPTIISARETPGEQFERHLSDSGEMTLEDLAPFIEVRDDLAYRRLKGEQLSARDQSLLDSLNKVVDTLLPRPAELEGDVRRAMAEMARLSAMRRNGDGRPG